METVVTGVGVALGVAYLAWRLGAFPGIVRGIAAATSPALLGALPLFAAGFVVSGRSGSWASAPFAGSALLVGAVALLAWLVHGGPRFLVPPAALDVAIDGRSLGHPPEPGRGEPATADDPRPVLESLFAPSDSFGFGPSSGGGPRARSAVEPQRLQTR